MKGESEGHYELFSKPFFSNLGKQIIPNAFSVFEDFCLPVVSEFAENPDSFLVFKKEVNGRYPPVLKKKTIPNLFESAPFFRRRIRILKCGRSVSHGGKLGGSLLFFVAFDNGFD